MKTTTETLRNLENQLKNKVHRKGLELERQEKRIKGLADVKPEYTFEYEHLQDELQKLHEIYVSKHINLDFLDHELG